MNDEAGHDASAAADELETLDPDPGPRCLITWTVAGDSSSGHKFVFSCAAVSRDGNTDDRNCTYKSGSLH